MPYFLPAAGVGASTAGFGAVRPIRSDHYRGDNAQFPYWELEVSLRETRCSQQRNSHFPAGKVALFRLEASWRVLFYSWRSRRHYQSYLSYTYNAYLDSFVKCVKSVVLSYCELLGVLHLRGLDDVDAAGVDACLDGLTRFDGEGIEGNARRVDDAHVNRISER